jgi:hypothetical protein
LNLTLDAAMARTVSIFDSQGKLLTSESLSGMSTRMRTDELSSGMYLLVITTEQGRFSQKLVKN